MKLTVKATIAAACALGMITAFAQSVQRGETTAVKDTQTVAQASTVAPVQVAQASAPAGGASTGALPGGVGVAGSVGSTVLFVGAAAAAVAAASGGTTPTAH